MTGDPEYEFYVFDDLKAANIARSRSELHNLIKHRGFPKPEKASRSQQSAARWRKSVVHRWIDQAYPHSVAASAAERTEDAA